MTFATLTGSEYYKCLEGSSRYAETPTDPNCQAVKLPHLVRKVQLAKWKKHVLANEEALVEFQERELLDREDLEKEIQEELAELRMETRKKKMIVDRVQPIFDKVTEEQREIRKQKLVACQKDLTRAAFYYAACGLITVICPVVALISNQVAF
jgi:hypothetical protein